ncbi:calcium-binding protein [Streptomyces sp. NPDC002643]
MRSRLVRRRMSRAASGLALAVGVGLAAPVVMASTAGAAGAEASAVITGHSVTYTAAAGQTNKLTVTASNSGDQFTYLIDDVVAVNAGNGCAYPNAKDRTKVSCTVTVLETQDPYASARFYLADGNDTVTYTNKTDQTYNFAAVDLGPGKDKLTETAGVQGNDVNGGTGDDILKIGRYTVARGQDGNDTINAADGTIVMGGKGADTLSAGPDSSVRGGAGNDVIQGGAGWQSLTGDSGNDTIRGGAGRDFIYGNNGNDVLYGNAEDDTIYGNYGNDKLYGGAGKDVLSGGPGKDVVRQS